MEEIKPSIFRIRDDREFHDLALKIFRFQFKENPVYRELVQLLGKDPVKAADFTQIPFMPVMFFRDKKIICGNENLHQKLFTSSGTTGSIPSNHFVRDISFYEASFNRSFRHFYGDPAKYRFLALLPGYLEREGSSLVYMLDHFIRKTVKNGSGFFLRNTDELRRIIREDNRSMHATILFGAAYSLLDFAEAEETDLKGIMVMETGGMKGRRKEMIREELHEILCKRLNVNLVHSEYGMTELLSQAYSTGGGIYRTPPWMKVLIRDPNDPFQLLPAGKTGGINIIDLANIYSCSFIATQDLGRLHEDGSFEVLGRFDDSDARGCNLLVV